jgi:hypothetical protein
MTGVKTFKTREDYFRWLWSKDDRIRITHVVNEEGDSREDRFHEELDSYTVTYEWRSNAERT